MAITENTYTGDGSTVLFSFTFEYIAESDIKITLDGTPTTAYTLANATTIQFNTAPANGVGIRIYRDTNIDSLSAEFFPGSAIRAEDLNNNFTQNLYVTQEVNNNAVQSDDSVPFVNDISMGGYKITNLADPVAGGDAATRSFVEQSLSSEFPIFYRRWSKTATGGETSLSGTDDNGISLSYVAGSEKVFINGALQVRGVDYTGTTGTTLTGIPALTAGDIVEVHSSSNYTVATLPEGSITNANVDGGAAIQYSKLNLSNSIVNADVNSSAGIVASKLNFTQSGTGATTRTVESKLRDVVSVKDFGAVGDGVTDDTAAIQAAINYAQSLVDIIADASSGKRNVEVDFCGLLYGIGNTLSVTKAITLKNGSLRALQAPSVDNTLLILFASAEGAALDNISIDGGLVGGTRYADLLSIRAPRVRVSDGTFIHFPNFGIEITSSSQEAIVSNCIIREWLFTEAGTADGALRTAVGLDIQDNDNIIQGVVIGQCLRNLDVNGGGNQFIGCHFYNGASTTTTEDVCVRLYGAANLTVFSGCYFDNGIVKCDDVFNHTFTGCSFLRGATSGTNSKAVDLVTSTAPNSGAGLIITGCTFRLFGGAVPLAFSTTGSGSWAADRDRKIMLAGNSQHTGDEAWSWGKFGTNMTLFGSGFAALGESSGEYLFSAKSNLRLNCGGSNSVLKLSQNGTSKWDVTSNTIEPSTDLAVSIGTTLKRPFQTVTGRLLLIDGVNEPGTPANNHAVMYIDTADGDLKIKFGDGTVKTIVTDT